MNGDTKCCLGIIIVFLIIAVFIFWPRPPVPDATYIDCYAQEESESGNDGYITFTAYENHTTGDGENDTDGERDEEMRNATILVNLTYPNNTKVKYNLTTDFMGKAKIENLSAGNYTISAVLVGNETHNASAYKESVQVLEYVPPKETSNYDYDDSSSYTTTTRTVTRTYWVYV